MVSYIAHCGDQYYRYNRRVFVDKRLPNMEYAQAGILLEPGAELLVSYETIVAEKDALGWLHVYGLFSASTRKHLGCWGKRIGVPYHVLKGLYENALDYNVYTGEFRKALDAPIRTIGVKV